MASYSLSYTQYQQLHALKASCLLPEIASPGQGELVKLFKQNKVRDTKHRILPYADLLEIELLKMLPAIKERFLADLKACTSTYITADLFSWKTIQYHESFGTLKWREAQMSEDELVAHRRQKRQQALTIEQNEYETLFGTKTPYTHEDDEGQTVEDICWSRYGEKVETIFRFSDLALRLSLALGPTFYPFIASERIPDVGDDAIPGGYSVMKRTLKLKYYPFGVSQKQIERLLSVDAENKARTKTTYEGGEFGFGHESLLLPKDQEDEYADMPPLIPMGPVPLLGVPPSPAPSPAPAPPAAPKKAPASWPRVKIEGVEYALSPPSKADNSFHYRGCECGCDDSDDE